ncbi:MAG TPA: hypothetical protein VJK53_04400 [Candidatus Paceibacterota bacterium]
MGPGEPGGDAVVAFLADVFGISIIEKDHGELIRGLDSARSQQALQAGDSARVDSTINEVRAEEQRRVLGFADTGYPECAPAGGGTFETGEPEQPHRNRPDDGDSL